MNLLATMDALLRDPDAVYSAASEGRNLGALCGRMLLIFLITTALYGVAMGSYRWLHPDYFFSSLEVKARDGSLWQSDVAGVDFQARRVYVGQQVPADTVGGQVRFNITHPTDPYPVAATGQDKGYGYLELGPEAELRESDPWRLPLLVAWKVPLLFILTLAVCSFALYVLNLALEVRLRFMPVVTVMCFGLAATGVMLGVMVPITFLFSVVTADYHFMKMLHLLAFLVAGIYGVRILYRGLVSLAPDGAARVPQLVFAALLLYGLVGGQVAWTLKPYLGTPYLPATPPFRVERGNVYVSALQSAERFTAPVWNDEGPAAPGAPRGTASVPPAPDPAGARAGY